jgi:hypothetical protein
MELYDSLERVDSSAKDSIPLALPKNWPKESIQESRVPRLVPPLTYTTLKCLPSQTLCQKLIKIDILLSHVNVTKLSTDTWPSEQQKKLLKKTKKRKKTRKKTTTFFNPKTETDPDRKLTFEQNTDPDPDRLPKVYLAGLYFRVKKTFLRRGLVARCDSLSSCMGWNAVTLRLNTSRLRLVVFPTAFSVGGHAPQCFWASLFPSMGKRKK